jgi:pSer/pThr/pTyr-binding forkhead associated (FHA) protein
MKVSLMVLTEGKASGQKIPITLSQFLIGRDPQCHLRPASAVISKRHCAVLMKDGKVLIRDFNSTNGTFVNNEQIKGEREVQDGDSLRVGPLTFKVAIEVTTPVNKPTPPPPVKAPAAEASDDESVAAMLLSLQDDGSGPSSGLRDEDGVPQGSTVMDIAPVPSAAAETPKETEVPKEETKKPEPVKKDSGNTSSAAKAILEKYTRRPRG